MNQCRKVPIGLVEISHTQLLDDTSDTRAFEAVCREVLGESRGISGTWGLLYPRIEGFDTSDNMNFTGYHLLANPYLSKIPMKGVHTRLYSGVTRARLR